MAKLRFILLIILISSSPLLSQEIIEMGTLTSCPGTWNVAVVGSTAYLTKSNGYSISSVDISDPETPILNTNYSGFNNNRYLDAENNLLVCGVRTDAGGFSLFEIDQGVITEELATVIVDYEVMAVLLDQNRCYIASTGGLYIYDVTNPETPVELSFLLMDSGAYQMDIDGNLLSMALSHVCRIVDVSNPDAPALRATINSDQSEGNFLYGDLVGNVLYAAGWNGLRIYSLSSPSSPVKIGEYTGYDQYSRAVKVIGDIACVSNGWDGMMTLDVSDPTDITYLGLVETPAFVADIDLIDNHTLALTDFDAGLLTVDISIPATPTVLGQPSINGLIRNGFFSDGYSYMELYVDSDEKEMLIVDLTSGAPEIVNNGITIDHSIDFGFKKGDYLYMLESEMMDWNLTSSKLITYDKTNPINPVFSNEIEFSTAILDLEVQDDFFYLMMTHYEGYPTENNELVFVDLSEGSQPDATLTGTFGFYARMFTSVEDRLLVLGSEINGWDIDSTIVYFYDISSPVQPELTGSVLLDSTSANRVNSMQAKGSYLYTTTIDHSLITYLIGDNQLELTNEIELDGGYLINQIVRNLLVVSSYITGEIQFFDITNPSSLSQVAEFEPADGFISYPKTICGNDSPYFMQTNGVQVSFYDMNEFLSVDDIQDIKPVQFEIGSIYPNPFNSSVTIPLEISKPGSVKLSIYNVLGQKIDGYEFFLNAGAHSLPFQSQNIASGMYTVVIEHRGEQQARTMYLLK